MSLPSNTAPLLSPERVSELRAWVRERLAALRAWKSTAPPDTAPRYDEVFLAGTAWLERLAFDDSWEE